MNWKTIGDWVLRALPALILIQTLRFKFTGDPVSVYIFSTLGVEPWGRILTGVLELAAGILLLVPSTAGFGALLSTGLMGGAIMSHLTMLGIEVQGDGGSLFRLAIFTLVLSLGVLWLHRKQVLRILPEWAVLDFLR